VPSDATYLWSAPSCSGIVVGGGFHPWTGFLFRMPEIFALLEAAGRASDRGAAAAQAVVSRSLCCNSSQLGQCNYECLSTGERKKNNLKNNQPAETGTAVECCWKQNSKL